jgi:autotransporter-associated beta strand protein
MNFMNLARQIATVVIATAAFLCLTEVTQAQLTFNYNFTVNTIVPDEGQINDSRTLGGLDTFSNVTVRLNLGSPAGDTMVLGDMYSTLTMGGGARTAVLLNRPGRDDNDPFGSFLNSLNVTLDDSASHPNIWGTTSSTGIYNSDGRLGVDPYTDPGVPFNPGDRHNTLTSLNGAAVSGNQFTLLMSDTSGGATAQLNSWGVSMTGTAATAGTVDAGLGGTLSIDDGGNTGATNTLGATVTTTQNGSGGTLLVTIAGQSTFTGTVVGSGALQKAGAGTLVLSNNGNSYTGGTSVTAGTLLVTNTSGSATGTGAVTVNGSGTTLGGTGIITGSVTLGNTTPGAIINPGLAGTPGTAGSVGTLSVGSLTLTGANTVHIDVSGTGAANWDQLIANGVTLGSTSTLELSLANGLAFAFGSQYVVIDNTSLGGISGSFSGIAEGGTYTFNGYEFMASYIGGTGNDFILVAVPEPATWVSGALALGAVAFGFARRRSRVIS